MDATFWHKRWEKNEIGFHQDKVNALLVDNLQTLSLAKESRIFVPLCGKTRDIEWLLSQGYSVVGVELSKLAVEQLFAELGVEPDVSTVSKFQHFNSVNIDIFVGDIFDLSAEEIDVVDAIYDRAALVALPADLRAQYASHITKITNTAPQLLICFEYEQTLVQGPPFSVDKKELDRVYSRYYDIKQLACIALDEGLKGKWPAQETVWFLQ